MALTLLLAKLLPGALGIDNGLGLTPPRGWRSWNSFDCLEPSRILTQEHMIAQMDAVLDQSRSVDGKPTSLAQLGFDWISMDDGWQRCNCSVRQDLDPTLPTCDGNLCFGGHCSWHDASGRPRVRPDRFPDMKKLVDYGHARQLKVGTYLNNCICNEHGEPHYEEDVAWMVHEMGFDGVKIDNCGSSTNVTHWAELINRTGKALRIENCHNSWPDFKTGVCPMNFFRTGGDISADISSILNEAYATVDAADLPEPRSGPGCWAYPDMSEVGNFAPGPSRDDQERTRWGLWSIISSPLILGFDLNDSQTMDGRVWPIITNTDALRVSDTWAGHPGTLIQSYPSTRDALAVVQGPCDGSVESTKWSFQGGQLRTPLRGTGPTCLTTQSVPCPPPTTAFPHVQCGLAARNCSELPSGDWTLSGGRIQWNDHHSQLSCLYANPIDFNTSTGYFTRKAATVGVSACADGPRGPSPWAHHISEGASPLRDLAPVPRRAASAGERSLTSDKRKFSLTSKGELKSDEAGEATCLRVAPVSGVQLWAKPMSNSSAAVLLINPSAEEEVLDWPVHDLPARFPGGSTSFTCEPGQCLARDVWARRSFPVSSATLRLHFKPWASTFYILTSDLEAISV
ncbi:Alpha-galactosidase (Alpha-D-galactoside galactohydrolase) (Melibiase) [Durusdinium trenchii]|uniref:Alpha-galactosidase n=1 Tax=Durusdinium trenchii TaxID=1381693 RepID=A0ABP0M302_9DINO